MAFRGPFWPKPFYVFLFLGPGSSAGKRRCARLSTAAPCRVLEEKWLLNGPWRTPGAQGAGKSPVSTLCCVRRAPDMAGRVRIVVWRCSYCRVQPSAAPGTTCILGVFLSFPWPQDNIVPVLLCFSCTYITLSKLPLSSEVARFVVS